MALLHLILSRKISEILFLSLSFFSVLFFFLLLYLFFITEFCCFLLNIDKNQPGEMNGESNMEIYNIICKIDSQGEFAV